MVVGNPALWKLNMKRMIVASKGRNPENRNDRSKRGGLVQMLDAHDVFGKSFTLTTVEKDNYVLEYED